MLGDNATNDPTPGTTLSGSGTTTTIGNEDETARLRRLVNLSPAAIVEVDADHRIRFANPRWHDLRGADAMAATPECLPDLLTPRARKRYAGAVDLLKQGTPVVGVDLALWHPNGSVTHLNGSLSMLTDGTGNFAGLSANCIDITERVIAERKLQASETRLRQILDNTVALIGIMTPDGTLIEANKPALDAGGLTRADVIGKKFWDCFWWNHNADTMDQLKQAVAQAAKGDMLRYDTDVRIAGDVIIPIDFMLSPVFDDQGRVELLVPSGFDISLRKKSEEQLAYVMREVNHRSKNMLSVVQSMLRQMRSDDVRQFQRDFAARLRALSACQDLLVHASNASPDIRDLLHAQLTHYAVLDSARMQMCGPPLALTPEAAQNIGMAIYELATNAGKYGALSNEAGCVMMRWAINDDRFTLHWLERDGPAVTPPENRGFGTVVLEDMLAMALNARTTITYAPDGLRWSFDCPVSAITSGQVV
jgi:PAS domain S-box-containing protein